MSGKVTVAMLAAYFQETEVTAFFTGMFRARPENYYNAAEVEIDIVRSEEDVSIVVQDLSTGYRMNSDDLYTNKRFKPPIHKEGIALNSHDLLNRMPGEHPFKDPVFRGNIITRMFSGMRKVERKIRNAIELQASQVLQTGKITLTDIDGNPLYVLDYKPKVSHFPTAGVDWDQAGADPLADIENLCVQIRKDSKRTADEITFGSAAWTHFIRNETVQKFMDLRRVDVGSITPMSRRGDGAIYRGTLEVGNNKLDMFTYDGWYKDPTDGEVKPYVDPIKVIVRATSGRLDATFGGIPNIGQILGVTGRLLPELPNRFSSADNRIDMFTNVWISDDGENLFGGVGARPLMIPTDIDSFGCLNTGITLS